MSRIRVEHGEAEAVLDGREVSSAADGTHVIYPATDLVRAVVAVFRAADLNNYADAVLNGLDREGLPS